MKKKMIVSNKLGSSILNLLWIKNGIVKRINDSIQRKALLYSPLIICNIKHKITRKRKIK